MKWGKGYEWTIAESALAKDCETLTAKEIGDKYDVSANAVYMRMRLYSLRPVTNGKGRRYGENDALTDEQRALRDAEIAAYKADMARVEAMPMTQRENKADIFRNIRKV